MEKVEIELKFPLENADEVIKKLKEISDPDFSYQKDTYFVPPHKNFLEQNPIREWLRVRETPKGNNFNYKNWHNKNDSQAVSCD